MAESRGKRVAVVGATGVVGETIASALEQRRFPVAEYVPVATEASAGQNVNAFGKSWRVVPIDEVDFTTIDYSFCTAGATVSLDVVPGILEAGCKVVDNTTAFRMDENTPLVIPEINGGEVTGATSLVACPNCTAIVLLMTLAPLINAAAVERVVVTSFQSVSGAGKTALRELDTEGPANAFYKPIRFNCLPAIGDVTPSGYSTEESKIVDESRKILGLPDLQIVPTTVRVPVRVGHAVSVNVEFSNRLSASDALDIWREAAGVSCDDELPTQLDAAGKDAVMVGHIREDSTRPHALSYWAVGDNLRKGAALNSVQIGELFLNA